MKVILKEDYLMVPEGGKWIILYSFWPFVITIVKISVKARKVTITGPRGKITKDFSHKSIDIRCMKMATAKQKGLYVRIQMWNGGYKQACAVTTFKSLISNCIIGVTEVSRCQNIL